MNSPKSELRTTNRVEGADASTGHGLLDRDTFIEFERLRIDLVFLEGLLEVIDIDGSTRRVMQSFQCRLHRMIGKLGGVLQA